MTTADRFHKLLGGTPGTACRAPLVCPVCRAWARISEPWAPGGPFPARRPIPDSTVGQVLEHARRFKRVSHQVAAAALLWSLPNFVQMDDHQAKLLRDGAVGLALTAGATWVSRNHGQRRRDAKKPPPPAPPPPPPAAG